MDGLTIKIEGILEATNKISKLTNCLEGKAMDDVLLKKAEVIAQDAKNRAPQGPTGNLKRSLHAKMMPGKSGYPKVAIAAVDRKIAPHGHLVEFGTSKMAARPYFRPAVEAHAGQTIEDIGNEVKHLIDKAV